MATPRSLLDALRARQRATRRVDLPDVAVATFVRLLSAQETHEAREEALCYVDRLELGTDSTSLEQDVVVDHVLLRAWILEPIDGKAPQPVCTNIRQLRESTDTGLRQLLADTYKALDEDMDPQKLSDEVFEEVLDSVKKVPERALVLSNGNLLRRLAHGLASQLASSSSGSGSKSGGALSPTSSGDDAEPRSQILT